MKYVTIFLVLMVYLSGSAQTISEWRGIGRTGVYEESGLLKEWPDDGPENIWSTGDLGKGNSSAAIGDQYIYVSGRKDSLEYLTAIDFDGKQIWQVNFGQSWNQSFPDTRTTPTINGGKVYLISGMGEVACHDGLTGERIWMRNAYVEFSGICNLYGISESPLIVDDKVIYTSGGSETSMIALNKNSGELIWKSEPIGDSAAYVSPIYVKHNNQEMIISVMGNWAFGVDPEDGNILWKYDYIALESPIDNRYMRITNCNSPLYHNGEVLLVKGYDHPAAMLALNEAGTAVSLKWINADFDTHFGGNVLIDGYVYGSNWLNNSSGNWMCVDWETGQTQWEAPMNNKGSIISVDGMLYCYDEKRGQIGLVRPGPEKFDLISSFTVFEGKGPHWAHPVIQNGILYVRHGAHLMAYNLAE